ncbi:histone acetyltransferase KAT6A isoform X2 [Fopius arisanus]|uniref:Histone acetyltransferase KAT6A isoform X2 n=1 Tax=Fopius arisanus TaxID=64838 RepID=A0A9R1TN56_9HYME|nr:PREDICTED: histone acetyltransferase KAT6A-like isoform X2 [Fopius arisanus]
MLEMNSQLEHDFVDGFGFTSNSKIPEEDTNTGLQILDKQIEIAKALECVPEELPQCEICAQKFLSKKELRSHITIHLGQPRIILKRCNSQHKNRKKEKDIYSLNQDKKGSLKLTLKKQKHSDFTVINRDLDFEAEITESEVADAERNDQTTEEEIEEESTSDRDENVMLRDRHEDNDDDKSSDNNDRPSAEVNEGDSGVGSDMANPSEKDDQNVDDLAGEQEETDEQEKIEESEDPEESDALEATCRETIENLKKLGEQSSSRSVRDEMSPRDPNLEPSNSPVLADDSSQNETPETSQEKDASNFTWISDKDDEDLTKNSEQSLDLPDPSAPDSATSLLQNFLLEHHRKNQGTNEVITLPVETEYVSLERLAETVNTCRICNEKFRDITLLDEHRAKAGHYQCNIPDCVSSVFKTRSDLTTHKVQAHGAPLSPSISLTHITRSSPQLSEGSPRMSQNSPHLSNHSPHGLSIEPSTQITRTSPHTHSPTFGAGGTTQMIPPVNFDQLPAPVQQLAQQVQRMPLPQAQMPSMPPNVNTMIPGPNYYMQPPGRPPPPPMYRTSGGQGMQYSPHVAAYLQSQYGPYQSYQSPPMHPQMPQQVPRVRYSPMMPVPRGPRLAQIPAPPRVRIKRPGPPPPPQTLPQQRGEPLNKQRRLDVLLPDRNEDADCHVIVQQKRNDGLPVIQNVQGASQPTPRNDSTIHLTDSITLSVRQPAQPSNSPIITAKKPDAKAVANVLAARGITVTPAANKNKANDQQKLAQQQQQQPHHSPTRAVAPPAPVNVLNLNSAISIIPTARKQTQQPQQEQSGQFAVPQNKQTKPTNQEVERPPRPPTVDLTQDTPASEAARVIRRGRPPRSSLTCQICDKTFASQEILMQHMSSHRGTNKLLHKCNLCTAQYPNAQALTVHKQTYHKEMELQPSNGGTELAIPVVDLKSPQALNRLQSLGIHSYIPLSQLSAQTGGYFGLPIITIDGPRNPNSCNLGALGATSILSLGPLKHLSNR